ncbi:MAG: urease accessory UreF family protein [Pseudomonadota bacterium]
MSLSMLRALHLGDSSFPSGAFAFSWGLERAAATGMVTRDTFPTWLASELLDRWAKFDRIILAGAWRCPAEDYATWEADIDVYYWSEPLRQYSMQAGAAFLAGGARFGDPAAERILTACQNGKALGHLPAVQGAFLASQGLPLAEALAIAAHGATQTLVSAAVRLSLISASEGQRAHAQVLPLLAKATTVPDPGAEPQSFAPLSEIAMLQPSDVSLFVN